MIDSLIGPRWPGDREPLPFADDNAFFASLTRDQRTYALQRWRELQTDLQMAMGGVASGLATINELHDAAVLSVDQLAGFEGGH